MLLGIGRRRRDDGGGVWISGRGWLGCLGLGAVVYIYTDDGVKSQDGQGMNMV